MDLAIAIISAIMRIVLELELCYATVRIIRMRSIPLFLAVRSIDILANELSLVSDISVPILQLIAPFWAYIFVPLLLSRGDIRARASRILLLLLSVLLSEALGTFAYTIMSGGRPMPANVPDRDSLEVVGIYLFLVVCQGALLEALVSACARIDHGQGAGAHVEVPVIAAMAGAAGLCLPSYALFFRVGIPANMALLQLAYALLSLGLGIVLLVVSRREEQARLEAVPRDAELRQVERLRESIAADIRRMETTHRLRHDLSNQVEVVRELVGCGELAEADRYLAQLQDQARQVAESPHTLSSKFLLATSAEAVTKPLLL